MTFQLDVADIRTVTPTMAPQPETSTAAAIEAIGGFAGQAVEGVQKSRVREEVSEISEATTAVGAAVEAHGQAQRSPFDPETGDLRTEGLPDELRKQIAAINKRAGDRFRRIASAVSQGSLPQNAAALEAEAAVKQLVAQTPGFSQEIRGLARELLGYDPTGFALRQTLDISSARTTAKTESEKRQEEAQAISDGLSKAGYSVPADTILGMMATSEINEIAKKTADTELDLGAISFDGWFNKAIVEPGVNIAESLSHIAMLRAEEGGVVEPTKYANAVIQQREAIKRTVQQRAAKSGGVSTEQLTGKFNRIDDMFQPLLDMIENNDMGNVLANTIETQANIDKMWGRDHLPMLTRVNNVFPAIAPELFQMLNDIADPNQFELLYPKGTPMREVVDAFNVNTQNGSNVPLSNEVLNTLSKLRRGEQLTEEERQKLPVVESAVTKDRPGRDKVREQYIEDLGNSGLEVRSASILATKVPAIKATDKEKTYFNRLFTRHVGQPAQEDLPGNLIDDVADEYLALNPDLITEDLRLIHTEQGSRSFRETMMLLPAPGMIALQSPKLSVKGKFYGGIEREFQSPAMKKLQVYIDAVHRGNWGDVFGVNKDTFAQDLVDRVNSRIAAKREQDRPEDSLFNYYDTITGVRDLSRFVQQGPDAGGADTGASTSIERPVNYFETARPEDIPVGVWQNNPLNLKKPGGRSWKWKGEVDTPDEHAAFDSAENGYRAGAMNLRIGFYRDYENTLERIIKGTPKDEHPRGNKQRPWATGNQTEYIKFLSDKLEIDPSKKLTATEFENLLPNLMYAMAYVEQGPHIYAASKTFMKNAAQQIEEGLRLLGDSAKGYELYEGRQ